MKDAIKIVILPLYRCKEDFPYYLFNAYKNNPNTCDLAFIEEILSKLSLSYNIKSISIEGGEITDLSDLYFEILFNLVKLYVNKIKINTNFIYYNKSLINDVDIIDVNYFFDKVYTEHKQIKENIKAAVSIGKIVNINTLDISLPEDTELENIVFLNKLGIKSWKILPYHQSGNNPKAHDYSFFERIVEKYLKLSDYMHFSFINKLELDGVIQNDNFPIKTIYLTPNSKLGLGVFENNKFSIKEFDDIEALEVFLKNQQSRQILICDDCKYKTKCLADRFFNPDYIGKSCSGFKDLIKTVEGK